MTTDPALSITARLAAHGLTVRPARGQAPGVREVLDASGVHVGFWRIEDAVAWLDEREGRCRTDPS